LHRLCGFPSADCCRRLFRLPATSSRRIHPSYRVSPSNTYPIAAAIRSSHGLWLPTALEELEVHLTRAKPARYVPPSGFGYPLDGLRPRIPCRFCFTPAALLGFPLRSLFSRKVSRPFSREQTHIPLTQRYFRRRSAGPARRASVSGFTPFESALRPNGVLARGSPAAPLGFAPLG
jgi:hypothetical protein